MKLLTGKEKILAALILKNGDKVMYQFAATKGQKSAAVTCVPWQETSFMAAVGAARHRAKAGV